MKCALWWDKTDVLNTTPDGVLGGNECCEETGLRGWSAGRHTVNVNRRVKIGLPRKRVALEQRLEGILKFGTSNSKFDISFFF